ncbi:phage portal protein [Oceanobacillus kimchii]|nr:phage portal protein [Oceanobacillus kimchii]MCT1577542.1 phage portal protein [Oceanobacillus kimchii]MCT2136530.1 phage portal protein [Oceanobacillus kimchii]
MFDLFKKHSELEQMYDIDLLESTSERVRQKQLAVQTCVNFIARIISQSEFRVRKDKKTIKDELYYRLNVRPNKNMTAAHFWQTVVYKLIHDNECLIVKTDSDDLVIADDYYRIEYGLVEDIFQNVTVKNFTYQRTFRMSEVIFLEYDNEKLSKLIDTLYDDYGELIGRLLEFQKHKNQIRSTVEVDGALQKGKEGRNRLQKFIDDLYGAIKQKAFAIVPQQKGFKYEEHSKGLSGSGQSIEDINKATNGFLDQVAKALGLPPSLIHGEMADVEKQTRNAMLFCIDPLLKKIKDELNGKFLEKPEFLSGKQFSIRRVSYKDIFDIAVAADKWRSSGLADGHELRDKAGFEESDDPIHDKFVMTKNYSETLEGGEKI